MQLLLTLLIAQGIISVFDTLYHHEIKAMLTWSPKAGKELVFHGISKFLYAIIFTTLALASWQGFYALIIATLVIIQVPITLLILAIKIKSRPLALSEIITHWLLALNWGAILILFLPLLVNAALNHSIVNWYFNPLYSSIILLLAAFFLLWSFREFINGLKLNQSGHLIRKGSSDDTTNQHQLEEVQIKTYLITGGSGFIGRRLCQRLINSGHKVIIVTRQFKATADLFNGQITLIESIQKLHSATPVDIIINLAGEPLAGRRWNKKSKQKFIQSRVLMTQAVADFVERAQVKPSLLINGSAIGFYGLRGDEIITESDPGQDCFSNQLCQAWEAQSMQVEQYGTRVCQLRTGIVLGIGGGALASLLLPFQFGLGGRMGNGKQWMSWIHIDDLIKMILFCISNNKLSGPINGVSPNPLTNAAFSQALGKALHRPAIFPVPAFSLSLMVGEMAEELLLKGQRVIPEKALESGFTFDYPELSLAFEHLFKFKSSQSVGSAIRPEL